MARAFQKGTSTFQSSDGAPAYPRGKQPDRVPPALDETLAPLTWPALEPARKPPANIPLTPLKNRVSAVHDGAATDADATPVQDLTMPRTMVMRLAKGVLPPNTQIQKDAVTALSKGATVFINHLSALYASFSHPPTAPPCPQRLPL